MTRLMKPGWIGLVDDVQTPSISNPKHITPPYIPDIPAVDKSSIQKGTLNDPVKQNGIMYLNSDHTSFIFLSGYDLWFQPKNSTPVKLT
jgi:hypothetical protein